MYDYAQFGLRFLFQLQKKNNFQNIFFPRNSLLI